MKAVEFGNFFEGAVSVEQGDGWLRPWRLPHDKRLLFPTPDDVLFENSGQPSAVRLRFRTDSSTVALTVLPLAEHRGDSDNSRFDLTVDNEIIATVDVPPGTERVDFENLPAGDKVAEIWLPPGAGVAIREFEVDDDAECEAAPDGRKRWVTYGSSLTHCVRANSAARVWPAIVARRCDLHVTSLGFGGQCHIDPMVALTIRDLPADYISLKMGINVMGHGSLNIRTFAANMIGFIQIIREKHPVTPIALVTSFCSTPRETEPNSAGMTLEIMRHQTADVYDRLVKMGDENLVLCDGLKIVDAASLETYSQDACHHNGDGIEEIADRWMPEVMTRFGFSL